MVKCTCLAARLYYRHNLLVEQVGHGILIHNREVYEFKVKITQNVNPTDVNLQ